MAGNDRALVGIFFIIAMMLTTFTWFNAEFNEQTSVTNSTGLNTFLGAWGPTMMVVFLILGVGMATYIIAREVT